MCYSVLNLGVSLYKVALRCSANESRFLQGRVLDSEFSSVNIEEKMFACEATQFVCDKLF